MHRLPNPPPHAGRVARLATPLLLALLACHPAPPPIATEAGRTAAEPSPAVDAAASLPGEPPRPISLDPPQGARDVDPWRATLAVTFDRSMDPEGWAWVTESPDTAPTIAESSWDAALRVNTAQVRLEPGRTYVVWINSDSYPYFRDPQGRTVSPLRWIFTTAAAPASGIDTVAAHRSRPAKSSP